MIDRVKGRSKVAKDMNDMVSNLGLPPIPQNTSAKGERSKIGAMLAKQWSAILELAGINESQEQEVESEPKIEAEQKLSKEIREVHATKISEGAGVFKVIDNVKSIEEPYNGEVLALKGAIEQMEYAQVELLEIKSQEIVDLQNTISLLESHNARLLALPTVTEPKDDPAVHEMKISANEEAYYGDLKGFK